MAKVPREAVEFTRMLVRSFYPPDYVVLVDAVLRYNNYCAHHDLARRLKIQPKELRQILVRMVHARLMRNEKRQQKRINFKDERKAARLVSTEFWYVPLAEVIDAFQYRVHRLVEQVEAARSNESAAQKFACNLCRTQFDLLDVVSNERTDDGHWVCDKMGVRRDRRKLPCGGVIREQDNSAKIKETERIKQKLDEELRVLRERAAQCSRMDIPAHPLEGADEATWGELVPETVGIHGEAVDEEGLSKELSDKLKDPSDRGDAVMGIDRPIGMLESMGDGVIPEKPMWFKEKNKDADEDDDWVDDPSASQNMLDSKTGTAASFVDDEKQYYERYMQEIAGEQSATPTPKASPTPEDVGSGTKDTKQAEVIDLDGDEPQPAPPAAKPPAAEPPAPIEEDEPEDVVVSVAGKKMMLSEVTEDMQDRMTEEEYRAYFALANSGGAGGDNDDDDDEFE